MIDAHSLEQHDEIWVSKGCPDALRGLHFRVSDVEIEDVGITEVFTVTLVSSAESVTNYMIAGTTADSQITMQALDSDEEHSLLWQQFEYRQP